MKLKPFVSLGLACMTLLTCCAILIPCGGSHITGGCYDGQAEGCGFVQLGRDQLGGAFMPPSTFLYHWTPAGSHKESEAMVTRLGVIREWNAQRVQNVFGDRWLGSTRAEFLVFDDASAFHQKVSSFLSEKARRFVTENSGGATWCDWLGILHTGDFDHYESLSVFLDCFEENLVSLELVENCFPTRGGSYDIYAYNFINENGNARLLALADFFLPRSGWEKKVSDFCLAKFRRDNASLVADGTVTSFSPKDLALFTVSRSELQIHFRCFQVTLEGGGESQVDIPWSELRGYLRPDGPARFLISHTNKGG